MRRIAQFDLNLLEVFEAIYSEGGVSRAARHLNLSQPAVSHSLAKLRQAFGRLIRRENDRGIFVMLDSRLPTRLTSAFPPDVDIQRIGLADAIGQTREFLK